MEDKTKQAAEAAGRMQQAFADLNNLRQIKFLIEEMERLQNQVRSSITALNDSRSASKLRDEAEKAKIDTDALSFEIESAESRINRTAIDSGNELYSLI